MYIAQRVHEEGIVEVANHGAVLTERPGEAEDDPGQRDNAHGHHTHHHGVDDVRVPDEASIEESQT